MFCVHHFREKQRKLVLHKNVASPLQVRLNQETPECNIKNIATVGLQVNFTHKIALKSGLLQLGTDKDVSPQTLKENNQSSINIQKIIQKLSESLNIFQKAIIAYNEYKRILTKKSVSRCRETLSKIAGQIKG